MPVYMEIMIVPLFLLGSSPAGSPFTERKGALEGVLAELRTWKENGPTGHSGEGSGTK